MCCLQIQEAVVEGRSEDKPSIFWTKQMNRDHALGFLWGFLAATFVLMITAQFVDGED